MNGISCTILGLATPSRIACLSPLRKELNLMRRNHVLTARLSAEELALLPALRHAIVEEVSQADVLVWALEDLCRRVTAGDQLGTAIDPDGVAVCATALQRLGRARAQRPWDADTRGRRPRLTASDLRTISALQQESRQGTANN